MSEKHPKTAVIVLHPYLPSEAVQIEGAREWGLPELQNGGDGKERLDIWFDDLRKVKTTNWPSAMHQRDVFLRTYRSGKLPHDEVFFAHPLCAGWSKKMAAEMVETIHASEALIYVHDMGKELEGRREFRPGDDMADFWEVHRKALKAVQTDKYRYPEKYE